MSLLTKRRLEDADIVDMNECEREDTRRVRCLESAHPDAHPHSVMERARQIQLASHSAGFDQGFVEVEYYYNGLYNYMLLEGAGQVTAFNRSGLDSETCYHQVNLYVNCKASMQLHQLVDVNRVMAVVQQYDLELCAIFGQCFKTSLIIKLMTS